MDISKGSSHICAFRHSRSLLVALAFCGIAVPAAKAGPVTTYMALAPWMTAIGMPPTGGENFNGFTADTTFNGTSISIGAATMTLGTLVADTSLTPLTVNLVRALPLGGAFNNNIDLTQYANIFTGQTGFATTPYIHFDTPVSAFFADFQALNDDLLRTDFALFDSAGNLFDTVTPPISTSGNAYASSFGFVTMAGECVTELRMQRRTNDIFGMDNIRTKACLTVPEPASLSLFGLGLIGLVASRRWRSWAR